MIGTAAAHANRTLLVVSTLNLAGSPGAWTARLDLGGNDMDVVNGSPPPSSARSPKA